MPDRLLLSTVQVSEASTKDAVATLAVEVQDGALPDLRIEQEHVGAADGRIVLMPGNQGVIAGTTQQQVASAIPGQHDTPSIRRKAHSPVDPVTDARISVRRILLAAGHSRLQCVIRRDHGRVGISQVAG